MVLVHVYIKLQDIDEDHELRDYAVGHIPWMEGITEYCIFRLTSTNF